MQNMLAKKLCKRKIRTYLRKLNKLIKDAQHTTQLRFLLNLLFELRKVKWFRGAN